MKILITGGSGGIGMPLTELLLKNGYEVCHLSRKAKSNSTVTTYQWDVARQHIDEHCLEGVDAIIHLAGEGIATEKWTKERKEAIIKSRTDSSKLLFRLLQQKKHTVKHFISSSAIGYYGNTGDKWLYENDLPADTGFLSYSCVLWEKSIDDIAQLGIRVAKIRTGVVLDAHSGALPELVKPIKYFVGAPLGKGNQYISWIHLEDICRLYMHLIQNESLTGVYNGVTAQPCTNTELTKKIARIIKRPIWPFNVPEWLLKIILGEMSAVILNSNRVGSDKIQASGFTFQHPEIDTALEQLLLGR